MKNLVIEVARKLRKHSTKSEKIFWEAVRGRKINNLKFNRQFPIYFEYEGKKRFFIADFYCYEKRLIVEIDGGIHEKQKDYDKLRTTIIEKLGIKVIRFMNDEIIKNIDDVIYKLRKYV